MKLVNKKKTVFQTSQSGVVSSFRDWSLLQLMLIAGLGVMLYANTFQAPFIFDDFPYIVVNPALRDLHYFIDGALADRAIAINQLDVNFGTRTVAYLSFALNYAVDQLDVTGYHLFNIGIHIINGWLVFLLVLLTLRTPFFSAQVTQPPGIRPGRFAPLLVALMFVCHPVQTQAVTYLSQRFASLATLFCLTSLVLYVRSLLPRDEEGRGPFEGKVKIVRPWFFIVPYSLSILAAVLAMKSKEIAFTFPIIIVLYDYLFMAGTLRKRCLRLMPFLLTMLIIPLTILGSMSKYSDISRLSAALSNQGQENPALTYLFTQFRVIVTYVRLLLLPVSQNLDYDYPVYRSFFVPEVWLSFLFLVAMLAGALVLYRLSCKEGEQNRAWLRLIAFGVFWFFITLSVESSILPLEDMFFEHRLYLPSIGIFMGIIALGEIIKQQRLWGLRERWVMLTMATVVVIWALAAFHRNALWTDATALWEDNVKKSPKKSRPYLNLAKAYQDQGRFSEALNTFNAALSIDPALGSAYFNRGLAYYELGQFERAVQDYNQALSLKGDPRNIHKSEIVMPIVVYLNRGLAFYKMGQTDQALKDYNAAIELKPTPDIASKIYSNRGAIFYERKDLRQAYDNFDKAVKLYPESVEGFRNRGLILEEMGQYPQAIDDYSSALLLKPDFVLVQVDRGNLYQKIGRNELAMKDFQEACKAGSESACSRAMYLNR